MSYYVVNIAVRWSNGDLEGFSSSALTEVEARKRAIDKAKRKAAGFSGSTGFDVLSKEEYEALSTDQQDELLIDWSMDNT